ncbi:MAG: hypothetical protein LBJ69_02160, partial [Holosporales bacterium]|nr:hypothetical protein [Holosporales bacterium]
MRASSAQPKGLIAKGTYVVSEGAAFRLNRDIEIAASAGIRNHSHEFYVGGELRVNLGDTPSTGRIQNHGRISIEGEGSIVGEGRIQNEQNFQENETQTELMGRNRNAGGYQVGGGYEYFHLFADELTDAAYFDLANDTKIRSIYTRSQASIMTPLGGQIPGTLEQESTAAKYVRTEVEMVDQAELPATDGRELTGEAFSRHLPRAYDMRSGVTILDIRGPTYVGESIYSLRGYVPNPDGRFAIQAADGSHMCDIPPVDIGTVITQTGPPYSAGADGSMFGFEQWDAGASGIDRHCPLFGGWSENREGPGDPVAIYAGDNSWYNGVYNLHSGGAVFTPDGAMFGGQINLGQIGDERVVDIGMGPQIVSYDGDTLYADIQDSDETKKNLAIAYAEQTPPVEMECQGGSKDEYNRSIVNMNGNSTLFFNIPQDENGNRIFSFYGSMNGTPSDRLIFENGTVLVKGDCSGFKGKIGVRNGASFIMRSSDATSSSQYVGKIFGGSIYVIGEDGNPDPNGTFTVSPSDGITPANMECGEMVLKPDVGETPVEPDAGEEDVPAEAERHQTGEDLTVDGSSNRAAVRIVGAADGTDRAVARGRPIKLRRLRVFGPHGRCEVETPVTMDSFILNEGTLDINYSAGNVATRAAGEIPVNNTVTIFGPTFMGSKIIAWRNAAEEEIRVNDANSLAVNNVQDPSWTLTNGVNLYFDFDPATNTSDHFLSAIGVTSGIDHQFILSGMRLLNPPTSERHVFNIMTIQGNNPPGTYPEIVIDDNLKVISRYAAVGADGISTTGGFNQAVPPGTPAEYQRVTGAGNIPGAVVDGQTYYFYGSNRAGLGNVMMTKTLIGSEGLEPEEMLISGL